MLRSWTFILAGVTALAMTAGCNKGGSSYKPKAEAAVVKANVGADLYKTLMPVKLGNEWTYDGTVTTQMNGARENRDVEIRFVISKVDPFEDGQKFTLDVYVSGEPTEKQTWVLTSKGLFSSSVTSSDTGKEVVSAYSPMQPILTLPLKEGAKTTWDGVGFRPGSGFGKSKLDTRYTGLQVVDSKAGSFEAIVVENDQIWDLPKNMQPPAANGGGNGTSAGNNPLGGEGNTKSILGMKVDDPEQKKATEIENDTSVFTKGRAATTLYFAPGTGIVRFRQEVGLGGGVAIQVLKLKRKMLK